MTASRILFKVNFIVLLFLLQANFEALIYYLTICFVPFFKIKDKFKIATIITKLFICISFQEQRII